MRKSKNAVTLSRNFGEMLKILDEIQRQILQNFSYIYIRGILKKIMQLIENLNVKIVSQTVFVYFRYLVYP